MVERFVSSIEVVNKPEGTIARVRVLAFGYGRIEAHSIVVVVVICCVVRWGTD